MSLTTDQHDEKLARVLNELADAQRAGRGVSLEEAARAHPELAEELRDLWGAVMVADAVASHASLAAPKPSASTAEPAPLFELPALLGDYELLEEIGRGGMGIVYRARQISLDRIVAVKMILRGTLASPDDLA